MAARKKQPDNWKDIGLAAAGGAGGYLAAKGAKKAGAMILAKMDPEKTPAIFEQINPGSILAGALGAALLIFGKKPIVTGAGVGMVISSAADLVGEITPKDDSTASDKTRNLRSAIIEDAEIVDTADLENDAPENAEDLDLQAIVAMAEDLDLD